MLFSYQIRGTNGTGKTTIVRALLKQANARPHHYEKNKVRSYRGELFGTPIYFLGSYETNCGGCDTIPSVAKVAELLERYMTIDYERCIVVFEGLMISHMLGTVGAMQEKLGKDRNILAYLDTPLELCIQRVVDRRVAQGDLREFNPRNVILDHERVILNKRRAEKLGYRVVTIDHRNAYHHVYEGIKNELATRTA